MINRDPPPWGRWQTGALAIGVAALGACALGALWRPAVFLHGYLVGFSLVLGATLGSLALLMLQHLTGGRWGMLLRRPLEAATRTLPLVAIFFLPLVLRLDLLYPWAGPTGIEGDELLDFQRQYLSPNFFIARAAGYFAIWFVMAFLLNHWARWRHNSGDPRAASRSATLSGPGLVVLGLTVTFAAIDWLMSLTPGWWSTIFPVVIGVGQLLTAMALMIVVLAALARYSPLNSAVSPAVLNDAGNLLLAMVMFWAYVSFSQFLLIWAGNLPEEVRWFTPRYQGGWQWMGVLLLACQFGLPFVLLLWRGVKRRLPVLAAVAAFILVMRVVDLVWQIVPSGQDVGSLGEHGFDLLESGLAVLGLGGIWLGYFLIQLRRMPLLPDDAAMITEDSHHE